MATGSEFAGRAGSIDGQQGTRLIHAIGNVAPERAGSRWAVSTICD